VEDWLYHKLKLEFQMIIDFLGADIGDNQNDAAHITNSV
jgi:hypothetical protein